MEMKKEEKTLICILAPQISYEQYEFHSESIEIYDFLTIVHSLFIT